MQLGSVPAIMVVSDVKFSRECENKQFDQHFWSQKKTSRQFCEKNHAFVVSEFVKTCHEHVKNFPFYVFLF